MDSSKKLEKQAEFFRLAAKMADAPDPFLARVDLLPTPTVHLQGTWSPHPMPSVVVAVTSAPSGSSDARGRLARVAAAAGVAVSISAAGADFADGSPQEQRDTEATAPEGTQQFQGEFHFGGRS